MSFKKALEIICLLLEIIHICVRDGVRDSLKKAESLTLSLTLLFR